MGSVSGGGSKQSGKTKSSSNSFSQTLESGLSQEQLKILQQRQQQYNDYFLPQLVQGLESTNPGSEIFTQQMGNNAQQVNAAFNSSQVATNQILAQHNLAGGVNGASAAALKAQNERARASALANAYSSQLQNANADRQRFLQLGLGMSPQTTTAAPFHQESTSESESVSKNSGWSAQGSATYGAAG